MNEKLAVLKKSFASIKLDYETTRDKLQKSNLIGGKSGAQRQRLLDTNEKSVHVLLSLFKWTDSTMKDTTRFYCIRLEQQNDVIQKAKQSVAETEEVGVGIIENLARNREQIESIHGKVNFLSCFLYAIWNFYDT